MHGPNPPKHSAHPIDAADVSVVIPTFDRAVYTCRALASVWAQTAVPGEVIVVDDGSTDDTAERIRQQFPTVVVLRQPNRGVSAARNRGIEAATGRFIALLDSDDEWLPRKLERQIAAMRAEPSLRLCHTDEIWIRNGRRVNQMRKHQKAGGSIYEMCLPLCAISPSSVLMERTLLDEVGLFDESMPACEDYDLWLRICAQHPVLFVDEPAVIKYGGHADQLSRRFSAMDRFRIDALERILDRSALTPEQTRATVAMLRHKVTVYANGARKRGRRDEAAMYETKLLRWASYAAERLQTEVGPHVD